MTSCASKFVGVAEPHVSLDKEALNIVKALEYAPSLWCGLLNSLIRKYSSVAASSLSLARSIER